MSDLAQRDGNTPKVRVE